MQEAIRVRRAWLAALLSLLVSGLGQLYCGRLGRALLLFGLTILLVPLVYLPTLVDQQAYGRFSWIFVVFVALAVMKLYVTVDAWLVARRTGALRLRWYNRWYVYAGIALIASALGLATPYHSYSIPSTSMVPTLLPGDYVLTEAYRDDIRKPQIGDIAIVERDGTFFVKRIVASGGDRVQMIEGRLTINGVAMPRHTAGDMLFKGINTALYRETLPNGRSYRIMELSDHEFLDDTMEFTVPLNSYFVLGDNRDNSRDSRVTRDFGYMPAESTIAHVLLVWWAKDWSRIGTTPEQTTAR
jgi:signal peptidase I